MRLFVYLVALVSGLVLPASGEARAVAPSAIGAQSGTANVQENRHEASPVKRAVCQFTTVTAHKWGVTSCHKCQRPADIAEQTPVIRGDLARE